MTAHPGTCTICTRGIVDVTPVTVGRHKDDLCQGCMDGLADHLRLLRVQARRVRLAIEAEHRRERAN